jgi:glycosyltransferase involved in cell wall biosynthesis
LAELDRDFEIILVDDGSTDGSAATAQVLCKQDERRRLIINTKRQGMGAGLRAGLRIAQFPLLAYASYFPQSGRYEPAQLGRLLSQIDHVDLITGYRVAGGKSWRQSWDERLYRWLVRAVFAVRLRDLGCHLVLARRAMFARIPIQSNGRFAHVEIIAKANFLGFLMTETGVEHQPATADPDRWRQTMRELLTVFRYPDFGPPVLPVLPVEAVPTPTASEPSS